METRKRWMINSRSSVVNKKLSCAKVVIFVILKWRDFICASVDSSTWLPPHCHEGHSWTCYNLWENLWLDCYSVTVLQPHIAIKFATDSWYWFLNGWWQICLGRAHNQSDDFFHLDLALSWDLSILACVTSEGAEWDGMLWLGIVCKFGVATHRLVGGGRLGNIKPRGPSP